VEPNWQLTVDKIQHDSDNVCSGITVSHDLHMIMVSVV